MNNNKNTLPGFLNAFEDMARKSDNKGKELAGFVMKNVENYISKYGYDKFDINLPINFDTICYSVTESNSPYGLKLETIREPDCMIHNFYYGKEKVDTLKQEYLKFNQSENKFPSNMPEPLKRLLSGLSGDAEINVIKI